MSEHSHGMVLRSIRVDKNNIGYLKWLLESHDGMATPTTREGSEDVIDLLIAPDFEDEMNEFIENLKKELHIEIVKPPKVSPL